MRFLRPHQVATKADLRQFAIQLLTRWIADLNRDKVRFHFPRRSGLMRLIPDMPFHLHPELFLQISGVTKFVFPEETCRVGPGEGCLVSRGLPHRERVRAWKGKPFYNFVISYAPDRVRFHLAYQHSAHWPDIRVFHELEGLDGVYLAEQLSHVVDWFQEDDVAHQLAVKGLLLANISMVLVAIKEPVNESHEPFRVMQARQLVMQNLSDPQLSVERLGHSLRSSADYLSRLFRQTTGKPLVAYITERRMMRARDLLESSALNIAEISRATGYDDPSYFTRVFRREVGLAPRVYRERVLKNNEWIDPNLVDGKWTKRKPVINR